MDKRIKLTFFVVLLLLGLSLFTGCQMIAPQPPTPPPGIAFTVAAETLIAELTEVAALATPTPVTPPPTDTPVPTETPSPTEAPSPTPLEASPTPTEPAPVATPTGTPEAEILFEDDFSTRTWFVDRRDNFGFDYVDDGYLIYVNILNAPVWSIRRQEYADVRLEIDAARTGGHESGYYGLVCRHGDEDDNNYYALVISSDGSYGIAKNEAGEFEFIEEGTAESGIINPGNASNRVRADCVADRLTLYANGHRLLEVRDDDFQSGVIGVIAGTRLGGPVEVTFEYFAVMRP